MLDGLCGQLYELLQSFVFDVMRSPFGDLITRKVASKFHTEGSGRLEFCPQCQFFIPTRLGRASNARAQSYPERKMRHGDCTVSHSDSCNRMCCGLAMERALIGQWLVKVKVGGMRLPAGDIAALALVGKFLMQKTQLGAKICLPSLFHTYYTVGKGIIEKWRAGSDDHDRTSPIEIARKRPPSQST